MDVIECMKQAYLSQDEQMIETAFDSLYRYYRETDDPRARRLMRMYTFVMSIVRGEFETFCRGWASPEIADYIHIRRTGYRKLTADQIQSQLMEYISSI